LITASNNAKLKLVRGLLEKSKIRHDNRQFVLEGLRLVQDAVEAGVMPDLVLYRWDMHGSDLVNLLNKEHVPCVGVEPKLFNELSDTQTPQGILAVCPWLDLAPPESMDFVLILDQLTNPGNLGSALRTAAAVGVDAVILTPGSVDPYNPKVVRGGMGAHLRVPILEWDWDKIANLHLPLFVAEANGQSSIYEWNWTTPCGIVIGGEAHGPQLNGLTIPYQTIFVPMEAGESLNATVAASIILYEVYRQRLQFPNKI
jgi:RNA methyltransferase, TrmH family